MHLEGLNLFARLLESMILIYSEAYLSGNIGSDLVSKKYCVPSDENFTKFLYVSGHRFSPLSEE